jgi:hypothetical protein
MRRRSEPTVQATRTKSGFARSGVFQTAIGFGHCKRLDDRLNPVPRRESEHLGGVAHRPSLAADDRLLAADQAERAKRDWPVRDSDDA